MAPPPVTASGSSLGGHVTFKVNEVLAIQPEMFFVQKGLTGEDPLHQGEFSYNVDYISLPILARFSLTGANGLQFLAGPSFNFVARARLTADALVFEEGSVDRDIKSEVEDVDFGCRHRRGILRLPAARRSAFREGLQQRAEVP